MGENGDPIVRGFRNGGHRRSARDQGVAARVAGASYSAALETLVLLDAASGLLDLSVWPSLKLEKLKGDRKGQHSIRVNKRYRICFVWHMNDAFEVEIVDYH